MDINKFQFPQMFNDGTGKTNVSKVVGFIGCMAAVTGFIMCGFTVGIIALFGLEGQTQTIIFFKDQGPLCLGLFVPSSALLGIDRFKNEKPITSDEK